MAASYLNRLDESFGAYGVNGYVFTPGFVATPYSKEIVGSSPALLPAEVASKIYDTVTTDAFFMTVQYIGLSMDGTYGSRSFGQFNPSEPLVPQASQNVGEQSFNNQGAIDEK
jgi:hypothetical protein